MGFFDFLGGTTRYKDKAGGMKRLDLRREFLITPYAKDIEGARILDLASHDGRWSYALADAGAKQVVGIEARPELVEQFAEYPEGEIKDRVSFITADIFDELPRMIAAGETFDVVAVYGLYYHIMDHYRLLQHIARLQPKLVIIDSEFATAGRPLIELFVEDPDNYLNSIAHADGQRKAPIGVPSRPAMELMAESLGYATEWADWETVPADQRKPLEEYYRDPVKFKKQRGTCALRPLN